MLPVLAVNIGDIIGNLACFGVFGLFIAAAVWTAVKEAKLKAGLEIPVDDVPQKLRDAAGRLVPGLEVTKALVKYRRKSVPKKYELTGHVGGKPIEVEVMPHDAPPYIREIEIIYEPSYGRLHQEEHVELAEVPVEAMQAALDHMDALGCAVEQIDRAKTGTIFDREAYELKGSWKNGRVEIKVLATGEVIKVELKIRKKDQQ